MVRRALLALSCAVLLSVPFLAQTNTPPAASDADKFIKNAETKLDDLITKSQRGEWVAENFITDDTQEIASEANELLNGEATNLAKQSLQFQKLQLDRKSVV